MSFIQFADHECTCDHAPTAHDDGFGCVHRGCDCLAGWLLEPDDWEAAS